MKALQVKISLQSELIGAARTESDALKVDLAHSKSEETALRSQIATLRVEAANIERRCSEEIRREKVLAAASPDKESPPRRV